MNRTSSHRPTEKGNVYDRIRISPLAHDGTILVLSVAFLALIIIAALRA